MKHSAVVLLLATAVAGTCAAPQMPFGITFDNGKLGVNFLGFNAAVGLGGQLNPNGTGGGLFAEAGTPFGQRAVAGLGGNLDGRHMGGGLYAGATAGGNIKASAGLNGDLFNDEESSRGRGTLYSGASAGPAKTYKSIDKEFGDDVDEYAVKKIKSRTKVKELVAPEEAPTQGTRQLEEHNEVALGSRHAALDTSNIRVIPVVVRKKAHRRAHLRKGGYVVGNVGYGTSHLNAYLSPEPQSPAYMPAPHTEREEHYYTSVHSKAPEPHGVAVQKEVIVSKQHRPGFFEDIFNIPISTLGAVSRFLSNSAGAAKSGSGSIDIRKSVRYE